jgi:hypothetical protein
MQALPSVLRRGYWAAAALVLLAGCISYPDSSERIDDDIVYTHRADRNFGLYKTFAVDPVVHLAAVQADGTVEPATLDKATSDALVAQVVSNMKARGYEQVASSQKPDVGLTLTAISGLASGVVSGAYYWGYYGYYWGYPGWGYYYPYQITYAYKTGTLLIDLVDLVNSEGKFRQDGGIAAADAGTAPVPGALPVVWTAAAYKADVDVKNLNDVITVSNAGVIRAQQAIDQAFKQSPYLQRSM